MKWNEIQFSPAVQTKQTFEQSRLLFFTSANANFQVQGGRKMICLPFSRMADERKAASTSSEDAGDAADDDDDEKLT